MQHNRGTYISEKESFTVIGPGLCSSLNRRGVLVAHRLSTVAGADRIFHWETGTSLRNSSGDGRLVNFFEQHAWNMALLELFVGGAARFATYECCSDRPWVRRCASTAGACAGSPINLTVAGTSYMLVGSRGM